MIHSIQFILLLYCIYFFSIAQQNFEVILCPLLNLSQLFGTWLFSKKFWYDSKFGINIDREHG